MSKLAVALTGIAMVAAGCANGPAVADRNPAAQVNIAGPETCVFIRSIFDWRVVDDERIIVRETAGALIVSRGASTVALWLAEEQSDSETVRFLNAGMDLPKSEQDARAFAERYAEFNHRHERIMFSIETLDGELAGGINIHSMNQRNGTFETGTRIYRALRGRGAGASRAGQRRRCTDGTECY